MRDPYDYLSERYLIGYNPIPLRWNGWNSDTHILSRNGWSFHATRMEFWDGLRITCTSPEKQVVLLAQIPHFRDERYGNFWGETFFHRGIEFSQCITKETNIHMSPGFKWHTLEPIDVIKPVEITLHEIFRGSSLKMFHEAQKIVIPPASVEECLNHILKLQYPAQKEIIKQTVPQFQILTPI